MTTVDLMFICAPVAQLDRVPGFEPVVGSSNLSGRAIFTSPRALLMAANIEEIAKELIDLPRHQRLTLVRLLLDLDQPGPRTRSNVAWDEEIRARVKAVDEGRVEGVSYEQIKKEMAGRFPSR